MDFLKVCFGNLEEDRLVKRCNEKEREIKLVKMSCLRSQL